MDNIDSKSKAKPKGNPAWRKGGASPNPSGAPKTLPEVRLMLLSMAPDAVKAVFDIAIDPKSGNRDRLQAAKIILDFALPKPTEPVQQDSSAIERLANILSGKDEAPEESK